MSESVEGNAVEPVAEVAPAERRCEYRLNKVLGAVLGSGEESVRARIFVINISRSGLKATHQTRLPELDQQELSLFLSAKDQPLVFQARVAWQKELAVSGMFEIGFQFLDMSDADAQRLEDFIRKEAHREEGKVLDLSSPWKFGKHG
ncbi:MAG: PilZ domain-containing protein [Candidatus Eremiobacteraeota bacterium]|nr:PilZ domain-containing protein [Candidatus Eremiobacteraeota bacterium]MCW5868252.1 PilZ domain-containing protein [Candidatus Eremiobacteraeota bacterium]